MGTGPNAQVRVLIADLAPEVIVTAHVRPALVVRGRRIALVADHRYRVTRTRRGWRVRDLDGSARARGLCAGPLRVVSGAAPRC